MVGTQGASRVRVVQFSLGSWFGFESLQLYTTTTATAVAPFYHRHNPTPAGAELDRLRRMGVAARGSIP